MKFNVFFTCASLVGQIEVENSNNPVESSNIQSLISRLALNFPKIEFNGVEIVGLRIERIEDGS